MLNQILSENKDSNQKSDTIKYQNTTSNKSDSIGEDSINVEKNIISEDVELIGDINFDKKLMFDGKLTGEISSNDGTLILGENSILEGNIKVHTIIVFGKIKGNIIGAQRCEIKDHAEIIGDVSSNKIKIEEGAVFIGTSTVGAVNNNSKNSTPKNSSSKSPNGISYK